jgi:hypothetical protein
MTVSIRIFVPLLLTLLPALTGCDGTTSPSAPTAPAAPPAPTLAVFRDSGGFSTSDLRDAQDQIIQISSSSELIWTADGTRLPGYRVTGGPTAYFIEGRICPEGCAFEVRFGTEDGERRAYLTVDYGHDNPGTVVDVEVTGGELLVTQTDVYPPGTPTLSGIVTGTTAGGPAPLEGVVVARAISTGWRTTGTDRNGFYEIHGLIDGNNSVYIAKDGYEKRTMMVLMAGNTRFDIELDEVSSP